MFRPKPSFLKFLFARHSYGIDALFFLGFFSFFIAANFLEDTSSSFFQNIGFASLALGTLFIVSAIYPLWKRFAEITPVFANGAEIQGVITDIYLTTDGGIITYEFSYLNSSYRATDQVNHLRKINALRIGQNVTLVVNQHNPAQAFLRDLYL